MRKKILLPVNPPKPLELPVNPPNALQAAIDRALRPSYERKSKHWGFIYDNDKTLALIYEFDEENIPISICPIPINHDISIYQEEIKKSINKMYGTGDGDDAKSPVDLMNNNIDNFLPMMEYICDTDHYIESTLKVKHLGTGKEIVSKNNEYACEFFKTDDKIYDLFYDQYEELIDGFGNVRYLTQKAIIEEATEKMNEELNEKLLELKDASNPAIYGRTYIIEIAHNPRQLNNKNHYLTLTLEVKL